MRWQAERPHAGWHNTGYASIRSTGFDVAKDKMQITFDDILWLRRAATKTGADHVPVEIADKLIKAGLIEVTAKPQSLKITDKGRIALSKLG